MSDNYIGTISELRPILKKALTGLTSDLQDEVITLLKKDFTIVSVPEKDSDYRHIDRSLTNQDTYYAIHNSDIELLKEASIVVSVALSGLSVSLLPLIPGLVYLIYKYRCKRIRLTAKQGIVLKTLKLAPIEGWTSTHLNSQLPTEEPWIDSSEIEPILQSMKSVIKEDGIETVLVTEQKGLWRVRDI